MRAALAALVLAGAVAGCAPVPPQTTDQANCVWLFEQYDVYSNFMPNEVRARDGRFMDPSMVAYFRRLLVQNDCVTRSRDVADLDALAAAWAGRGIVESGPPSPYPGSVHVGTFAGDADAARAASFFEGLGVRSKSIGAQGLGRRVFVGPFRSQGAMNEAMTVAREAGFVAPYVSRFFRF
jgi:hypothetical protein